MFESHLSIRAVGAEQAAAPRYLADLDSRLGAQARRPRRRALALVRMVAAALR